MKIISNRVLEAREDEKGNKSVFYEVTTNEGIFIRRNNSDWISVNSGEQADLEQGATLDDYILNIRQKEYIANLLSEYEASK